MSFSDGFRYALWPGMHLPDALGQLFDWIEAQGRVSRTRHGVVGTLLDPKQLARAWKATKQRYGTAIEFMAQGNAGLDHWFGRSDPAVLRRVFVFAKTGGDGSMAALWLDDAGVQRIVHMGSGSGSTLSCVLADQAVDFLRLLAIGYEEICWDEEFATPPASQTERQLHGSHPNEAYRHWLTTNFGVSIPTTALEVVRYPAHMNDADSPDPFCRWVSTVVDGGLT